MIIIPDLTTPNDYFIKSKCSIENKKRKSLHTWHQEACAEQKTNVSFEKGATKTKYGTLQSYDGSRT